METKYCKFCETEHPLTKEFWRFQKPRKPQYNVSYYCRKRHLEMSKIAEKKRKERNPEPFKRAMAKFDRSLKGRYRRLKSDAKSKRSLEVTLTFEQYSELINNPCHYCGAPVPEVGYGLDRIDSNKAYVPGNCVPCCKWCNVAKGDRSVGEFLEWIEQVQKHSKVCKEVI